MKAKLPQALCLSIGMIVKNGGETFEKSLQSLEHLRNTVPSELIVVDTGSTDGSVEIARRYTDQVYHFEWCDDFAAARNASLDYAAGEWFLFLDADEWFEDTSAMERFLMGTEQNKYVHAGYFQRNYADYEGESYTDFMVARLFKRLPGRRFVSRVHEYVPVPEKIKILEDYVHHYGYVPDKAGAKKKQERNIPLLLEILEEQLNAPDNSERDHHLSHAYFQLMREYAVLEDWESALECGYKGLEIIKKQKRVSGSLCGYYKELTAIHFIKKDYNTSFRLGEDYKALCRHPYTSDIDISVTMGDSKREQKQYEAAIACYDEALELFRQKDAGLLDESDLGRSVVSCVKPGYRERVYHARGFCLASLERFGEALEQFSQVDLQKAEQPENILNLECACVCAGGDGVYLWKRYQALYPLGDENRLLKLARQKFEKLQVEDKQAGARVAAVFAAQGRADDSFSQMMRLRNAQNDGRMEAGALEELLQAGDINMLSYGELLYFVLAWGTGFSKFAERADKDLASAYLQTAAALHADFWEAAAHAFPLQEEKKVDEIYWLYQIYAKALIQDQDRSIWFIKYCEVGGEYIHRLYQPDILEETHLKMLPPIHRFFFYAHLAVQEKKKGNLPGYIRILSQAGAVCPEILPYVKREAEAIQQQLERETAREEEMKMLMGQIKETVRVLAAEGRIEEADEALYQYERINPGDTEIPSLRLQIHLKGCHS